MTMTFVDSHPIARILSGHIAAQILHNEGIRFHYIKGVDAPANAAAATVYYSTDEGAKQILIPFGKFLAIAAATRKRRSSDEGYVANRVAPGRYRVSKPHGINQYDVLVGTTGMTCSCPDFGNLQIACQAHKHLWENTCKQVVLPCKHIYTVLFLLGFGSMKEYLASFNPGGLMYNLRRPIESDFPCPEVTTGQEVEFFAGDIREML